MNRARAKRRLMAWRRYTDRVRQLTPNWWENDRSTGSYIWAFRRWRWHAGTQRSRSSLPWNTDPERRWAKGMPEAFVRSVIEQAAEFNELAD